MKYNDLRIDLHKSGFYTEEVLTSIGNDITVNLPCDASFQVAASVSQIKLKLNTTKPSELNLSSTVTNALSNALAQRGLSIPPNSNMFNTLISYVGGKHSIVIIML